MSHRLIQAILFGFKFLLLCGISSSALAETNTGVFLDRAYYAPGESPPVISIAASNGQSPVAVDVHIGVIDKNGTIYEFPNWNTNLQPWLPNVTLPAGFSFPTTPIFSVPDFLSTGIGTAFLVMTEPGTTNILSLDLAPFNHLPDTSTGSRYGALFLTHSQTFSGTDVSAGGTFYQANSDLGSLVGSFEGEQPALDQCVLNQIALDFTTLPNIQITTLDAGETIQLTSSAGPSIALLKDTDSASLGYILYAAATGQLGSNFYQGGATFTFQGTGGANVQAFTTSVAAPTPLTLTQPALSISASHNAAQDMPLIWNGNGGVGEVNASVTGTDLSNAYNITCRFADDGSAVIPAELLTELKNSLGSGGISIPGFELPDISIPGLGATATLSVSRNSYALFNTAGLNYGVVTVDSGTSMSLTLD